jgi:hypothetical protein
MRKRLLIGFAALAVGAVVAVPAAQAAVPPIKAFPKFFSNGLKMGLTPKPSIAYGTITLHNNIVVGNLTCNNVFAGRAHNETTEGTEKGFLNTVGYMTFECKSQETCKVTNTKGEEVEGIYATAEAPPSVKGTEIHNTGITSLPWTGELIERETEKTQVLTKHVKIWIVLPPLSVGRGEGCAGTELEFEDREGAIEKEEGFELAPIWVNGSRNGLKPSHGEFHGEEGKTEKGFPQTGMLNSPQVGPGSVTSTNLTIQGAGGASELLTAIR